MVYFGSRYKVLKHLATGGMADVYLALLETEGFSRPVVIKKILDSYADNPYWIGSFFNEAKIMSLLNHSHMVQVLDFGKSKSGYFLAMEYIDGGSLWNLQQEARRLAESYILWIGLEILKGLSFAHKREVLHRDLSPSNILISKEGEIKITDFGIAKLKTPDAEEKTLVLKGKHLYMSPEQKQKKDLSYASDLYSLTLILSELLGDTPSYLKKGLKEDPKERFRHCEEFEDVLYQRFKTLNDDVTQRKFCGFLKSLSSWNRQDIFKKETKVFLGERSFFFAVLRVSPSMFRWAAGLLFLVLGRQTPEFYSHGYLSLNAKPWGKVYISSEYIGTTPLVLKPIPTGNYSLEISNPPLQRNKKLLITVQENQVFKQVLDF